MAGTLLSTKKYKMAQIATRTIVLATSSVTRNTLSARVRAGFRSTGTSSAGRPNPTAGDMTVDGKRLHCEKVEKVTTDPMQGRVTTIVWTSPQVPIFGTVRVVRLDRDGKETSRIELLAFGETGGAEKPLGASGETSFAK